MGQQKCFYFPMVITQLKDVIVTGEATLKRLILFGRHEKFGKLCESNLRILCSFFTNGRSGLSRFYVLILLL